MSRIKPIIINLLMLLVFYRCPEPVEDPDPPVRPNWVECTLPESVNDRGIRSDPISDAIVLEWHPNPDEDLAGYLIYRTTQKIDNPYQLLADINVFETGGNDTIYYDETAPLNELCYYYLKAYDQAGNRSQPTDTIFYRLLPKVDLIYPLSPIAENRPLFSWNDLSQTGYEYVIQVIALKNKEVVWIYRMSRPNYADFLQTVRFNKDNTAIISGLITGESYQWGIETIGAVNQKNIEVAGSKSYWGYFTVN